MNLASSEVVKEEAGEGRRGASGSIGKGGCPVAVVHTVAVDGELVRGFASQSSSDILKAATAEIFIPWKVARGTNK